MNARATVELANIVFDNILDVFAVAEATDAAVFVAGELIVFYGDARHPGAEIETVAQVSAAFVVLEHTVGLAPAGVKAWAAAVFDEAIGDAVAIAFLDADAVGWP